MYTFRDFYISDNMLDAIKRYIEHGIEPGSFLTAIITNNLNSAVAYADDENIKNIPAFVSYFYNHAPSNCWGSIDNMDGWMIKKYKEAKKRNK